MSEHRHADDAARVLRAARDHLEPHDADDPAVTITLLRKAIVARRRRRVRVLFAASLATAAVGGVALFWAARTPSSVPVVASVPTRPIRSPLTIEAGGSGWLLRGATTERVLVGEALAAGDVVETEADQLTLRGPDGTRIVVGVHSSVGLARDSGVRWLTLTRGALALEVAKLAAGERFVIATPDREVEVKGTRFRVKLTERGSCGSPTVTQVGVEEGLVTVRASDDSVQMVAAGEQWPAPCRQTAPAQAAPAATAPAQTAPVAAAPVRVHRAKPSTLSIENDLFAAAVRAHRKGDRSGALRALDELLLRYPASPLRDAAVDERNKVLALPVTP